MLGWPVVVVLVVLGVDMGAGGTLSRLHVLLGRGRGRTVSGQT